jgi:hypothetical protein
MSNIPHVKSRVTYIYLFVFCEKSPYQKGLVVTSIILQSLDDN